MAPTAATRCVHMFATHQLLGGTRAVSEPRLEGPLVRVPILYLLRLY